MTLPMGEAEESSLNYQEKLMKVVRDWEPILTPSDFTSESLLNSVWKEAMKTNCVPTEPVYQWDLTRLGYQLRGFHDLPEMERMVRSDPVFRQHFNSHLLSEASRDVFEDVYLKYVRFSIFVLHQ
jgi:hypothetical protein